MHPNARDEEAFANRREAGAALARQLGHYKNRRDVVVLALLRGGVPVGYEVARELAAPLEVFFVRKLGLPGHGELAMGAIASGGVRVLNEGVVGTYGIPGAVIDRVAEEEQRELERRERAYRGERAPVNLRGRVALLIDDGLATGSTMKAAVRAVQAHAPSRTVVAVPVGAPDTCREIADLADEVICVRAPETFAAVGQWYRDFAQTEDADIRELLRESAGTVAGER